MSTLGEEAVDAINGAYGRHPGSRAAHAKGVVCSATFSARPEASRLTRAEHMSGAPVDATVRFSNSSGDPSAPDFARDLRGLAAKFHLPGGEATDLLAVTLPCFMARTPEDFVRFARASRRSPARPLRVLGHVAGHREARRGVWALLTAPRVSSYAGCRYNSVHAFRWVDASGSDRHVRCAWVPEAEARVLSRREAKRRGPDGLLRELEKRLERGPVRFELRLQLAGPDDPVDDATVMWGGRGETVSAGVLEITAPAEAEPGLLFDPMRLTDGIEASADPILRFRPQAYDVSHRRRTGAADTTTG